MRYYGYTYPSIFSKWPLGWLWKKIFCRMQWHLWDEVSSMDKHYLYCDACGKIVNIAD